MRVNQLDQLIRLLQFNTLRYSPCGHGDSSQLSELPRNAGVRLLRCFDTRRRSRFCPRSEESIRADESTAVPFGDVYL